MTPNEKIHAIIHSASATAAAAGAGLAQFPCSDYLIITPIQVAMITAIGEVHGLTMTKKSALAILAAAAAPVAGRATSQVLMGWIPGWGNATNAATAAAVTEAIGWSADAILADDGLEAAVGA